MTNPTLTVVRAPAECAYPTKIRGVRGDLVLIVGHPPTRPSGPHPALESMRNLRYYQAAVVAAFQLKKEKDRLLGCCVDGEGGKDGGWRVCGT